MGVGVLSGVVTTTEAGEVLNGINQAIGGVMAVVPIVSYALSRGKAKQGESIQAILQILGGFATPPPVQPKKK